MEKVVGQRESAIYMIEVRSRMPLFPIAVVVRPIKGEVPCLARAEHLQKIHSRVYSDLRIYIDSMNDTNSERE
jgi:hypothetical protein